LVELVEGKNAGTPYLGGARILVSIPLVIFPIFDGSIRIVDG
jgi:hypothetical protein